MLIETESEDETAMANVEVLMALNREWTGGKVFEAADVAAYCKLSGEAPSADVALLRDYFDPRAKPADAISSVKIGKALRVLVGSPFLANGDGTIKLASAASDKHSRAYKIERKYESGV